MKRFNETTFGVEVPENTYEHTVKKIGNDDRFHLDYKFAENHRGGFILWFKDFGGRKTYPKNLHVIGLCKNISDEEKESLGIDIFESDYTLVIADIKL